jgi:hypothetical protein
VLRCRARKTLARSAVELMPMSMSGTRDRLVPGQQP